MTVGRRHRKTKGKLEKRLKDAKETISKLRALPLVRKEKLNSCRTFGLSKAAYGWVGRRPTKDEMQAVANAIWETGGGYFKAARGLRNVLEGGTLNLEAVIGIMQMCLLRKRVMRPDNRGDVSWTKTRGTLATEARKWMKETGWTERGKWGWQHRELHMEVNLARGEDVGSKAKLPHKLRERWRSKEGKVFVKGDRREARGLEEIPCESKRLSRMREMADTPERMALARGPFVTPAAAQHGSNFSTMCCW